MKKDQATIIPFIPNNDLYFKRGIDAFQKNDMNRAKKYFQIAISLAKNEEERIFSQCQLAIVYQHTGELTEAIRLLDELIQTSGDIFTEVYYFQANNYAFQDDFETALEYLNIYLEVDPIGDFADEALELKEMLEEEMDS